MAVIVEARKSPDHSKTFLDFAFLRDFELNGPSLYRICRTTLEGIKKYRLHPDLRVRERFEREAQSLRTSYAAVLWAMEKHMKVTNEAVSERVQTLRDDIRRECGSFRFNLSGAFLGPLMLWLAKREEKRLANGVTYEPKTFIERRNWVEAHS